MGEGAFVYSYDYGYRRDFGNGVENYECDGCRNDGFTHMGCGDCPHNEERIREYERKYCK